jgi:MFS family permease
LAEARGREPILLLGLGAVGVRAILFALLSNPWTLLPAQLLDWLCAAVIGVMMPLVIADLTRGTGRYNLARGFAGTATGIGAAQHHVLRLCGPVLLICRRPSRPGP